MIEKSETLKPKRRTFELVTFNISKPCISLGQKKYFLLARTDPTRTSPDTDALDNDAYSFHDKPPLLITSRLIIKFSTKGIKGPVNMN